MPKIKTIKQLCEVSSIPSSLIRSVIRQFGGWESFKELAEDVYNYGVAGGYYGFTYYKDTVAFAKRNKENILLLCKDMANDTGEGGIISFLSNFSFLKDYSQEEIADGLFNPKSDERTTIYNSLAWFAAEEVCRAYCEVMEDY